MATSIESDICSQAVSIVSLPEVEPIRWNKLIGKPTTDAAEALADLADAAQALMKADMKAVPTAQETRAAESRDLLRWDDERFRRMMFLCGHCHDAVRAALAAYSRGVERARPVRGTDGDRIASVIDGLSESAAQTFREALRPLSSSDVAHWSDPSVFVRSPEALQRLTPRLASEIYEAARRCCQAAVDAVTARHGHTAWSRDLVEMLNEDASVQAMRQQKRSPRFARKTYTRRCLTPPTGTPELPVESPSLVDAARSAAALPSNQRGAALLQRL